MRSLRTLTVVIASFALLVSACSSDKKASTGSKPGGGITVLPWPPGPRELSGHLPIVYNIYTEPAHRRRGLARTIMQTIHAWCLEAGYRTVALAASDDGRSMYESLGYRESPQPYMFVTLSHWPHTG